MTGRDRASTRPATQAIADQGLRRLLAHLGMIAADQLPFGDDGVVVCRRVPSQVAPGDCLLHLACDL